MFDNIGKPWPEHEPWFSRTTGWRIVGTLTDLTLPIFGLVIAFCNFNPFSVISGIPFFCFTMTALLGEV